MSKDVMVKVPSKESVFEALGVLAKSKHPVDLRVLSDPKLHGTLKYVIPTGIAQIDAIFGIGGLPSGRFIELFGKEASGKSTLALHAAANVTQNGGLVLYVDGEYSLDLNYAQVLGVNPDYFILTQPDCLEEAFETIEQAIIGLRESFVDCPFLVIYDSLISLPPRQEIEGDYEQQNVGLFARRFGQSLRKLSSIISKQHVCMLFINQLRDNISISYGSKDQTPGGRALKFWASFRVDMRQKSTSKDMNSTLIQLTMKKNKMAIPFKEALVELDFGTGFNKVQSLLEQAYIENIIISETAQSFLFEGEKISHKKFLIDGELQSKIQSQLKYVV